MAKKRSFSDRFWKDRSGKVVIGQTPNFFFASWIFLTIYSFVFSLQRNNAFQLGKLALGIWAILEIARGVNYFRRVYGAVVLSLILWSYVD